MKVIDLNDTVSVELTEYGADFLNEYYLKYCIKSYYKESHVFKAQLWYIMRIFGESISLIRQNPFNNLKLEE